MTEPEMPGKPDDESGDVKTTSSRVPSVRSEELFRGRREMQIVHGGETYRLLLTRNNKLLLQK